MALAWRRKGMSILAMLTGLILALAMVLGMAGEAYAASLRPSEQNLHIRFTHGISLPLGVIGLDTSNNHYYCMEAGPITDYTVGPVRLLKDDQNARRMAWILEQYRKAGARDHAAVAVIIQDHFGIGTQWAQQRESVRQQHPDIIPRAEQIWQESENKVAADVVVERIDAVALRSGSVAVRVKGYNGELVEGVPFTVTLEGPAHFVSTGKATFSGVSTATVQHLAWEADGHGEVTAKTTYEYGRLRTMDGIQQLLGLDSFVSTGGSATTFTVRKDFAPMVSTTVSDKVVDAGSPIFDDVTSGVADSSSHWVPDLALQAEGYYFDGLTADDLGLVIEPRSQESADGFLARIKQAGYRPSAYGQTSFTGPGQTVRVQAMTEPGGSTPYLAGEADRADGGGTGTGSFGTWVWVFRRASQSDEAKQYLVRDWSSTFLEAAESNVNRRKVAVESTVTEHSAHVGSELSDTITVSGFPSDHGSFAGNEEYGFGADRPHATVSVWWSGDADDAVNDEAYKPTGAEVPAEDEHHRLVGSWEIPARDGTFKFGAGSLDAHGEPVHIVADQHGWYVFVWEFAGDDRVMPAASRYDDAWERTRVFEPGEPEEPEEPEESVESEEQLPHTGISMVMPSAVAVAFLSVGCTMLAIVKRRRR